MRVPGLSHDPTFCRDYDIQYSPLYRPLDTVNSGGGNDDPEWSFSRINSDDPKALILLYVNQVLGDQIRFYGGCTHKITQGDIDADLGRIGPPPIIGQTEATDITTCLGGSAGDPDGTNDLPRMKLDIYQTVEGGGAVLWEGGGDYVVERNDGEVSNSSNPYTITVTIPSLTLLEESDGPDIWWGITDERTQDQDPPPPLGESSGIFPVGTSCITDRNVKKLWPWNNRSQNKIKILSESRNPGDYPNGLRDYQWYSNPIKRTAPQPSGFWRGFYIGNYSPACWTGNLCCNSRHTITRGNSVCDHYKSYPMQGQPMGESECQFDVLPSNGSGLPDPLCGVCEEGTYCCPYMSGGRCIPEDTFCCSECVANQICVFSGSNAGNGPDIGFGYQCCDQAWYEGGSGCVKCDQNADDC
jgi:hypothetical protein